MAGATHRGRVRPHNEDALAFDARSAYAVLADGMGGHNAGEVASRLAVQQVSAGLARCTGEPPQALRARSLIGSLVEDANAAVLEAASRDIACSGMGTTLVVALWRGRDLSVGHVGDSRLYRLRDGVLERLTRDHSALEEWLERSTSGTAGKGPAPRRNLLTRAVGTAERVVPDLASHAIAAADVYLLCSDGLTDMVADAEIREALVACTTDIDRAALDLVALANAGGGRDNISVVLARVTGFEQEAVG